MSTLHATESGTSAERIFLPDNFGILYYSLKRLNSTLQNIVIHEDVLEKRVKETSIYLSSFYLHELIKKTPLTREELYPILQEVAFKPENLSSPENFSKALKELLNKKEISADIRDFKNADLKEVFLKHFEDTLERTEKSYS